MLWLKDNVHISKIVSICHRCCTSDVHLGHVIAETQLTKQQRAVTVALFSRNLTTWDLTVLTIRSL